MGNKGKPLSPSATHALFNTLATGLAQAHEAGSHGQAVRRSEELRSVMVDALVHDLKTPLTTIEMAAISFASLKVLIAFAGPGWPKTR